MVKNCFLPPERGKSTSTTVLKICNSTTFLPLNSTFYTLFFIQIYIYNDPQNLQIYNTKMMIFYILQSFFGQNLQSTFTLRPPRYRSYTEDYVLWDYVGLEIITFSKIYCVVTELWKEIFCHIPYHTIQYLLPSLIFWVTFPK